MHLLSLEAQQNLMVMYTPLLVLVIEIQMVLNRVGEVFGSMQINLVIVVIQYHIQINLEKLLA